MPQSIEKAQKEGRRKMNAFQLQGKTIPHMVLGRFGATTVKLIPAAPGTGVIAGAAVRAVLDMIGVQDCLTKVYGSSNPKNVVKATMEALATLRTREQVEALRGVTIPSTSVEEAIKRGAAFMPSSKGGEKMAAPKNTVGEGERRGGRGGRGGPRGPRRDFGAPAPDAGAAPAAPAAPAPEAGA